MHVQAEHAAVDLRHTQGYEFNELRSKWALVQLPAEFEQMLESLGGVGGVVEWGVFHRRLLMCGHNDRCMK